MPDDRPRTYQSDRLGRVTIPDNEPTDHERPITVHAFQSHPLVPDVCVWDGGGDWPCGYSRDDHANPGDKP